MGLEYAAEQDIEAYLRVCGARPATRFEIPAMEPPFLCAIPDFVKRTGKFAHYPLVPDFVVMDERSYILHVSRRVGPAVDYAAPVRDLLSEDGEELFNDKRSCLTIDPHSIDYFALRGGEPLFICRKDNSPELPSSTPYHVSIAHLYTGAAALLQRLPRHLHSEKSQHAA